MKHYANPRVAKDDPLSPEIAPATAPFSPSPDTIDTRADDQATPGRSALERLILERLDDEKAQDVVFIDLGAQSSIADGLVIASGRSSRHVGAMADHLIRALKDNGYGKAKVEGLPQCDWVLIDIGDLIIHLFRPEVRSFYNIEKIWSVDSAHRLAH
jgi:ribosome-associated protein